MARGLTSVGMERFVSMIIWPLERAPKGTGGTRKGRAMPILIWIATIACMLEMMGCPSGQSHKDVPDRSE
jgi:hypothetical protein